MNQRQLRAEDPKLKRIFPGRSQARATSRLEEMARSEQLGGAKPVLGKLEEAYVRLRVSPDKE